MKSLQTLDKLLGRVACLVLQPLLWIQRAMAGLRSRNRAKTSVEQVLLIKFWGIGSLQLLTPACQLVRGQVPGARLTLLTLEENADFARGLRDPHDGSPAFDDIMILDVQSNWIGLPYRILRALWQLRRRGFDAVYDFEFFTRFSAIVSFASGAPERHGFHAPGIWRGGVHTRRVPFNRYWHVARNFSALAGQTIERDILPDELSPYGVLSEDECSIDAALAGWLKQGPLIVVNPNAGRLSLERRWPISRFARLAEDLVSQRGANVALIGSNSEVAYTRQAIDMIGGSSQARVRSFAGTLSMGELCALLQRADLVVTNDSGPMHIAAALGTPTIGLFGPETPYMYRPLGDVALALWAPPICSPCINVHDNKVATCMHGQPECLMRISVERVFDAAGRMLDNGRVPWRIGNPVGLEVLG